MLAALIPSALLKANAVPGLEVPVWGQYSIVGGLLATVLFVIIAIIRGDLVTGKRQDQDARRHEAELAEVNARSKSDLAAERERSKQWQEAYQASQSLDFQRTDTIARLVHLTEVFEAFINSLPQENDDGRTD